MSQRLRNLTSNLGIEETVKNLGDAIDVMKMMGLSAKDMAAKMREAGYSASTIKRELSDIPSTMSKAKDAIGAFSAGMGVLTGVISIAEKSQKLAINTNYQWADLQVRIFQNTVSAISAQNNYAQALALQAIAVQKYGSNSVQATNAASAASYVHWQVQAAQQNKALSQVDLQYAYANALTDLGQTTLNTAASVLKLVSAISSLGAVSSGAAGASIASAAGVGGAAAAPEVAGGLGGISGFAGSIGSALTTFGGMAGGAAEFLLPNPNTPKAAADPLGFLLGSWGLTKPTDSGVAKGDMGNLMNQPRDVVNGGANVSINVNVSRDVDLGKLRQAIQAALSNAFLKQRSSRGVY
jgi:hypothetical protein